MGSKTKIILTTQKPCWRHKMAFCDCSSCPAREISHEAYMETTGSFPRLGLMQLFFSLSSSLPQLNRPTLPLSAPALPIDSTTDSEADDRPNARQAEVGNSPRGRRAAVFGFYCSSEEVYKRNLYRAVRCFACQFQVRANAPVAYSYMWSLRTDFKTNTHTHNQTKDTPNQP